MSHPSLEGRSCGQAWKYTVALIFVPERLHSPYRGTQMRSYERTLRELLVRVQCYPDHPGGFAANSVRIAWMVMPSLA